MIKHNISQRHEAEFSELYLFLQEFPWKQEYEGTSIEVKKIGDWELTIYKNSDGSALLSFCYMDNFCLSLRGYVNI